MLKVLVIVLVALLAALALASRWLVEPLGLPAWLPTALAAAALALAASPSRSRWSAGRSIAGGGRRAGDPSREALRAFVDHELQRAREAAGDDPAWALVLGPSGAGKSAALLASGLRFRAGLGPERFVAGGRSRRPTGSRSTWPKGHLRRSSSTPAAATSTAGRRTRPSGAW
ncbi:MAG: hypothetical protein H6710_16575 [Myxococcales bacterium]|nr:hypothetical protein [Myxococcales bacterium]